MPFPYAVITNVVNRRVLMDIKKELRALWDANLAHEETNPAHDENGSLKSGLGVFLDHLYAVRSNSHTLSQFDVILSGDIWDKMADQGDVLLHRTARSCDRHFSLANFYLPGQEYGAHSDHAQLTAIFTVFDGRPVKDGGLCFPDADVKLKAQDNCLIVFPSGVRHQALPVSKGNSSDGPARYSVAMFLDKRQ